MKKSKLMTGLALSVFTLGATFPVQADTSAVSKDQVPVYRLYNKNTGEHFYTPSAYELINLQKAGWTSEGIGWYAPQAGEPVYRIYNPNAKGGDHYYTKSKFEAEHNVSLGWKWDNDGKPAFYSGGNVTNYVAYNPNAQSGAHNYTTSTYEQENLLRVGWTYGESAWNTLKAGTNNIDLKQIMNHDTTTIQGLWKNRQGESLEIIGDQFILNGKNITTYRQYQDDVNYVQKSIWDSGSVLGGDTSVTFMVRTTGGYAIVVSPAWVIQGSGDKSDSSKNRIMIGQDATASEEAFYRV